MVTAAIAFSLALFSHMLNHTVIRLQAALSELENPRKPLYVDEGIFSLYYTFLEQKNLMLLMLLGITFCSEETNFLLVNSNNFFEHFHRYFCIACLCEVI